MFHKNELFDLIKNNELNKALYHLRDFDDDYIDIKTAEIYLILGLKDRFDKNIDISKLISDEDIYSINFSYIYYTLYEYDEDKREFFEKLFSKNLDKLSKEELAIELKLKEYTDKKFDRLKDQIHYESITSTNEVFKKLVCENESLKVLVADEQVSGKGQQDRKFFSPKGGLYMSIKVCPKPCDIYYVTAYAGIAAIGACFKVTGKLMDIKWINDLYYDKKKVSGILTESKFKSDGNMDYAIIGIGINLLKNDDVPHEFKDIYGYLLDEYDYSMYDLIENVKYYLIGSLLAIKNGIDKSSLIDSYNQRLYKKNQEVEVYNVDSSHFGKLIGVDSKLNLILKEDGKISTYKYGDYRMKNR